MNWKNQKKRKKALIWREKSLNEWNWNQEGLFLSIYMQLSLHKFEGFRLVKRSIHLQYNKRMDGMAL